MLTQMPIAIAVQCHWLFGRLCRLCNSRHMVCIVQLPETIRILADFFFFWNYYFLSICGLRSRIGHASYQRKIFIHFSAFQRNDSIAENIGGNAWITVFWITPSKHGSPGQHILKVTTILSYIPSVAFANKCYTHALDVATQDPHGHLATGEWVLAYLYATNIQIQVQKRCKNILYWTKIRIYVYFHKRKYLVLFQFTFLTSFDGGVYVLFLVSVFASAFHSSLWCSIFWWVISYL